MKSYTQIPEILQSQAEYVESKELHTQCTECVEYYTKCVECAQLGRIRRVSRATQSVQRVNSAMAMQIVQNAHSYVKSAEWVYEQRMSSRRNVLGYAEYAPCVE